MKKFTFLLIAATLTLMVQAQPVLKFKTHALSPGIDNPMSLCSYADPGIAGEDITWDFTSLKFENNFIGKITKETPVTDFTESNVVLNEFGSRFFFKASKDKLEQLGYLSKSGNVKMVYDVPFVKMKYPFKMGDYFSGAFAGDYIVSDKKLSNINGDYLVEADAYGKILLPGDKVINNALRIKEVKNYTLSAPTNRNISITTYRWYISSHIYPCLVLAEIKTTTNGRESIRYQAAYNSDVIQYEEIKSAQTTALINSAVIFPTYVVNELNLNLDSEITDELTITIIDANGKLISTENISVVEGEQTLSLTNSVADLPAGNYLVELTVGNQKSVKNFIKAE